VPIWVARSSYWTLVVAKKIGDSRFFLEWTKCGNDAAFPEVFLVRENAAKKERFTAKIDPTGVSKQTEYVWSDGSVWTWGNSPTPSHRPAQGIQGTGLKDTVPANRRVPGASPEESKKK